uniref:Uncharacterized protein n=2 Tax=Prymnesium polylepis TaxID=72548 RepID=A0A7S4HZW4_9EUKA
MHVAFVYFDIHNCNRLSNGDYPTVADAGWRAEAWTAERSYVYTCNPLFWLLVACEYVFELSGRWTLRTLSCNRFNFEAFMEHETLVVFYLRLAWTLPMASWMLFVLLFQVYFLANLEAILDERFKVGPVSVKPFIPQSKKDEIYQQEVVAAFTRVVAALLYLYGEMLLLWSLRHLDRPMAYATIAGFASFALTLLGVTIALAIAEWNRDWSEKVMGLPVPQSEWATTIICAIVTDIFVAFTPILGYFALRSVVLAESHETTDSVEKGAQTTRRFGRTVQATQAEGGATTTTAVVTFVVALLAAGAVSGTLVWSYLLDPEGLFLSFG